MKAIGLVLILAATGWQTIDFNGLFTFRLPDGFAMRAYLKPEDTRAEYFKGQTKLGIVWGSTESGAYGARRQDWMHDYHEATTRLCGRRANIRTYWHTNDSKRVYRAELNVGNWDKGDVQLFMRMESDDPAMLEIADQIFKSINLPLPSPERSFRP